MVFVLANPSSDRQALTESYDRKLPIFCLVPIASGCRVNIWRDRHMAYMIYWLLFRLANSAAQRA